MGRRVRRALDRVAELPVASGSADDGARRRAGRVVLAIVGVSFLLSVASALTYPVLYQTDEKAHLAYVEAILDGRMPTVDTDVPADGGRFPIVGIAYDARYPGGVDGAGERGDVWVANHPPLYYVLAAPGAAAAAAIGWDHGSALTLRVVGALGFAVGLMALAACVDALFPGRPRATVLATGLAALCPVVVGTGTFALNDGVAFGAGTVLLAATLRTARHGPTTARLATLVAAAGAASLSRAALLPLVLLAAGVWLLATLPVAPRRAFIGTALVVGVPVAAAGWFYARNVELYGDLAASGYLLAKFDRVPSGSTLDLLFDGSLWQGMWQSLWGTNGLDGVLGAGSLTTGSPEHVVGSALVPGLLLAVAAVAGFGRSAWGGLQAQVPWARARLVGAPAEAGRAGADRAAAARRVEARRVEAQGVEARRVQTPEVEAPGAADRRGLVERVDTAALLTWTVAVLAAGVCLLGVASFVSQGGTPHPRYLLPALPMLVALLAVGLLRLFEPLDPTRAVLYGLLAVDLVLFSRAGRAIAGVVQVPDLAQQEAATLASWACVALAVAALVRVDRGLRLLAAVPDHGRAHPSHRARGGRPAHRPGQHAAA